PTRGGIVARPLPPVRRGPCSGGIRVTPPGFAAPRGPSGCCRWFPPGAAPSGLFLPPPLRRGDEMNCKSLGTTRQAEPRRLHSNGALIVKETAGQNPGVTPTTPKSGRGPRPPGRGTAHARVGADRSPPPGACKGVWFELIQPAGCFERPALGFDRPDSFRPVFRPAS